RVRKRSVVDLSTLFVWRSDTRSSGTFGGPAADFFPALVFGETGMFAQQLRNSWSHWSHFVLPCL
ncbi:MAG: hypothetical protein ACK557_16885, partial [Planctomycetota bacterium]